MKTNKIKIIVGILVMLGLPILLFYAKIKYSEGVNIKEWDNYYNENNIVLFYESAKNEKNIELNEKYQISDYVSNEETEFDKVIKCTNIVKSLIEKDDVSETGLNSALDIFEKKGDLKKVSFKDAAIIARDIINSIGVKSRIGVFRKRDAQHQNNYEYYVIEYWSSELNKWIMIDFLDQGYFSKDDIKLSAIEVLNCNLRKTPYLGNTSQQDYKNNLNKYLDSYSINIENSNEKKRSNCTLTYIKNDDALQIKFKNKYPPISIFTKESQLFEKSPFNDLRKNDEKAYLLVGATMLTEDKGENSYNNEKEISAESKDAKNKKVVGDKLIISAFKDGKVINSFYLSINGSAFEKIDGCKERVLEKGKTKIDLSIDGTTTVSSVVIEKN
ncbi:MAG: hypothetical protein E7207_02345 [Clostridium butyricum]|nr:hypothetical protein [Clostridium butyricum]